MGKYENIKIAVTTKDGNTFEMGNLNQVPDIDFNGIEYPMSHFGEVSETGEIEFSCGLSDEIKLMMDKQVNKMHYQIKKIRKKYHSPKRRFAEYMKAGFIFGLKF